MTKRESYTMLREIVKDNAELVAFIDHEIELLNKKNNAKSDKPTAKQMENESFKADILNAMTDKPNTISELQEIVPSISELSNQRVSAMVTALVNENKVVRTVVKRKAYFAKA